VKLAAIKADVRALSECLSSAIRRHALKPAAIANLRPVFDQMMPEARAVPGQIVLAWIVSRGRENHL
jgi:hypothetical protein